jgi:hypothetical protein
MQRRATSRAEWARIPLGKETEATAFLKQLGSRPRGLYAKNQVD